MKNNKDRKQLMLEYLSHESEQVIALAYMYAKTYVNMVSMLPKKYTAQLHNKQHYIMHI